MNNDNLFQKINAGIISEKLRAFNINLDKNSTFIQKYGGLKDIKKKFNDKHVIVAGAGPELANDLNQLKKYQHRDDLIIISADMALIPLVKHGISPGFVISCETTPVDFFSGVNTENMHLLAFCCISNSNLRKWKGNISFYNWMIRDKIYDPIWEKAGNELGFVATGSIVTSQAVSFALGCGIKSLMLIGNDLGYFSEYYVTETPNYKKNIIKTNRLNNLETNEFNIIMRNREYRIERDGGYYYTNTQFLAAKQWLEGLFKKSKIPVYDASRLGCSPNSLQKLLLKEYFNNLYEKRRRKKR